ncbi:hypothetical protein Vadar_021384 [Vaccinium darrowii]|uniref:Uncharacterized protein n=1 Tax=Vaccinium darrowii TaxID=229202 RepID=A0ACB7YQN9_9ERIC|nr:hypothetical protein Vadar_021384 [Vaccinium darrowii]
MKVGQLVSKQRLIDQSEEIRSHIQNSPLIEANNCSLVRTHQLERIRAMVMDRCNTSRTGNPLMVKGTRLSYQSPSRGVGRSGNRKRRLLPLVPVCEMGRLFLVLLTSLPPLMTHSLFNIRGAVPFLTVTFSVEITLPFCIEL